MLAELTAAIEAFEGALSGLDPSLLSGVEFAAVVETLARTEKRCAVVRVLAAARAAACGAHKDRRFSNPAAWVASASGVSDREARSSLAAVGALESCPLTAEALRSGEVSLPHAAEITKTEKAVPGSEADLLNVAAGSSVTGLRHAAHRRRLEAEDPDDSHRRRRRERYFRHWVDDHGMTRVFGSFTAEVGVPLTNRIDTETARIARATTARVGGEAEGEEPREPWDRLAADAVAKLILEGGKPKAKTAELVLVCDVSAFHRGHTHPGEVCHVIGGGPVPVSVAWEVAQQGAFIKAVLHDGVTISTVAHFGRHINPELRTALGLGDPPLFDGAVCAAQGCDRRYRLQWDHVDPVANRGPTKFDNLQPMCAPCHREKTRRDREAGLLDPHHPGYFDDADPDDCDETGMG